MVRRFRFDEFAEEDSTSAITTGALTASTAVLGTNVGTAPTTTLHVQGDIYASGDIIGLSDAREKTRLDRIEDALSKLELLTGYTFYMRQDAAQTVRRAGLLAQDCQRALPESVYTNADGTLGVAYASLTGLLVESIKELAAEVRQLAAEVRGTGTPIV